MYLGNFTDKEDLMSQFQISEEEMEGCHVLFAAYENESYEGYAMIVFQKDGKLYEVNGSHCSCHGLEGQWSPEETSIDALKTRSYTYGGLQADLEKFLVNAIFEKEVLN